MSETDHRTFRLRSTMARAGRFGTTCGSVPVSPIGAGASPFGVPAARAVLGRGERMGG